MPTQVACPKCNTKYKLSDNMLGKVLQCQKCGAKFKLPGPKKAAAGKATSKPAVSSAQSKELQKFGLDGPIQSSQDDLFDSPPSAAPMTDLLGNHALDPGFSSAKPQHEEVVDDGSSVIFENPAIAKKKKKKKSSVDSIYEPSRKPLQDYDGEPFNFKTAIKEVWFVLLMVLFPLAAAGVLIPYFGGQQLSYISLATRAICAVAAMGVGIWGYVLIAKTSGVVPLLLCMFVPFYIFYYLAQNWDDMKKFVQATGVTFAAQMIYVPFDFMGDGF